MAVAVSREIELKLIFNPADRDRLIQAVMLEGCPASVQNLDAVYYDTGDHALCAAGYSLRVRQEDGRHVQTIKASGSAAGLFIRPEWEHAVEGDAPVLDPIDDPLHAALGPEPLEALAPIFRTVVQRDKRIVGRDGARLEVAIDSGEVIAGNMREPLCELELELLSGEARALFDTARELDAVAPLRLSVLSKAQRGYRLAAGRAEKAVKAEPIDLLPVESAVMAFVRIAQGCLRQFRLNEDIFLCTGSPESLHQLRVGLRRLRSAFALFRPVLKADPQYRPLALALKDLGAATGELRDIDALMAQLGPEDRERLAPVREEAREATAMTLRLMRTRHLMFDLAEWLARADRLEHSKDGYWTGSAPAVFAAHALRRCRRQVKHAGKNWADLNAAGRHRVRKEAKKLRYAVEFFASLFGEGKAGKRQAAFREALEELQDELGALNDLAVAPALMDRFGLTEAALSLPPKRKQRAMAAAAGRKLSALLAAKRFWE